MCSAHNTNYANGRGRKTADKNRQDWNKFSENNVGKHFRFSVYAFNV